MSIDDLLDDPATRVIVSSTQSPHKQRESFNGRS